MNYFLLESTNLIFIEESFHFNESILYRVRSMNKIESDSCREVSTNGSHVCNCWISSTTKLAHTTDSIVPFDNHEYNRTHSHVCNNLRIKWLRCEMTVVLIELLTRDESHLHSNNLESTLLNASSDLSDKTTVNCIRLQDNE